MSGQRVAITYPVDGLVSFHYYPDEKTMGPLVATRRLTLIGDSGAFSAWASGAAIQLGAYADWVHRWREHLLWAASLDVIGDPDATRRNWVKLREQHGLETVPTVHAGCDPALLDAYAVEGATLVGLGGMAGQGQAVRALPWAVAMFRRARDRHPQVRFHLWGVTSRRFLNPLPAWSADSSGTLGGGYRYALLRLFDPATGRDHNVQLRSGKDIYQHSALLRRVYGVDPSVIERATPQNRRTLIRLAVAYTQQYAGWLQRRHKVSPPALLADSPHLGPRVHLVSAGAGARHDDLVVGVTDDAEMDGPVGPRVHLTDANHARMLAVADDGPDDGPVTGPRLHVAGTNPRRMAMVAEGADDQPTTGGKQ